MKNMAVMSLILLTQFPVAFAAEVKLSDLPAEMKCVVESENSILKNKTFKVKDLKTAVWLENLDARSEFPAEIDSVATTFNANNGCDNDYDFIFVTSDLTELEKGERSEVKGLVNYFNAESTCIDDACNLRPTENVTCTK